MVQTIVTVSLDMRMLCSEPMAFGASRRHGSEKAGQFGPSSRSNLNGRISPLVWVLREIRTTSQTQVGLRRDRQHQRRREQSRSVDFCNFQFFPYPPVTPDNQLLKAVMVFLLYQPAPDVSRYEVFLMYKLFRHMRHCIYYHECPIGGDHDHTRCVIRPSRTRRFMY